METISITVPRWEADLYISLFNGDGGGGFNEIGIAAVEKIIDENRFQSLVEVEEVDGWMIKCMFSVREPEPA